MRELTRMVEQIKPQAQALYEAIEIKNSCLPEGARASLAGELRLLRCIIHIVIGEMTARLGAKV
ncbi:hypothetical protein [Massilia forsythiae]|uniref:hypothetical protein n=1 Tax=Massilia forsythiae TaxID=2728020 RepID=UPI0028051900|nr:hypothetical protein [Massilia forsythiae]